MPVKGAWLDGEKLVTGSWKRSPAWHRSLSQILGPGSPKHTYPQGLLMVTTHRGPGIKGSGRNTVMLSDPPWWMGDPVRMILWINKKPPAQNSCQVHCFENLSNLIQSKWWIQVNQLPLKRGVISNPLGKNMFIPLILISVGNRKCNYFC